MSVSAKVRSLIRRTLPAGVRLALGKAYYPGVVDRFPETRWPPSAAAKRLLAPGDAVVDAGANVGYVTRLFSRWVGPSGRVFSFEPVPDTFALLAHNVSRLGLANVRAFPFALGAADGDAEMEIPDYADGGENYYEARIAAANRLGGGRRVRVQTRRLDSVLAGEGQRIRLLKIDVEGFERDVILGASALIASSHPALIVEVNGDPLAAGTPAERLFAVLRDLGYRPFSLEGGLLVSHHDSGHGSDAFFLASDHINSLRELVRA